MPDTDIFNDEELFYMNRIAFLGFKRYGINLNFRKFINDLTILQSGLFSDRIDLWIKLAVESEEKLKPETSPDTDINLD